MHYLGGENDNLVLFKSFACYNIEFLHFIFVFIAT